MGRLSFETRKRAVELSERGMSARAVATELNVSKSVVGALLLKMKTTQSLSDVPHPVDSAKRQLRTIECCFGSRKRPLCLCGPGTRASWTGTEVVHPLGSMSIVPSRPPRLSVKLETICFG